MIFTIIIPTIGRDTLTRTIQSIDIQKVNKNVEIQYILSHDNGTEIKIGNDTYPKQNQGNDYGNEARNKAFKYTTGDFICYLDDDDYYVRDDLFIEAYKAIKEDTNLLIFPATRYGEFFFNLPPGIDRTVSCQYMHRRTINDDSMIFPATREYAQDGLFLNTILGISNKFDFIETQSPFVRVDSSSYGK